MALVRKVMTTLLVLLLRAGANNPATVVDVIMNEASTSTLEAALIQAGLLDILRAPGPFTVFAPSNTAFDALPTGTLNTLLLPVNSNLLTSVLTYHWVNDTKLLSGVFAGDFIMSNGVTATVSRAPDMINTALYTLADQRADNGVVHVIDGVLVPAGTPLPDKNIVTTASSIVSLSTFMTAIQTANLEAALGSAGLTVFAPSNTAFSKLGTDTVDALLMDENRAILTAILQYHVSLDMVLSTNVVGVSVNTLNGSFLVEAGTAPNTVRVVGTDSVGFESTDIRCAGTGIGVSIVHIIDTVLLPPWYSSGLLQITAGSASISTAGGLARPMGLALFASALLLTRWLF